MVQDLAKLGSERLRPLPSAMGYTPKRQAEFYTCHITWHTLSMHCTNIRQLRNTRRLKTWLRTGNTVELRERDEVIARIVPEKCESSPVKYLDFAARRRKMFGDKVFLELTF
ncbi:MAG: hypothetical protein WB729_23300 [Candidatus Sulfotelmatobacter sp.]